MSTVRSRVALLTLVAGTLLIGPAYAAPPTRAQGADTRLTVVLGAPVTSFFRDVLSLLGLYNQPSSGATCTESGPCSAVPNPPPPDRLDEGCGLDPNGCKR
jgi:hypothetical protein